MRLAFHRNVDTIALATRLRSSNNIKTAVVCPPAIHRPGRGTGNTSSAQVYVLATTVVQRGKGIQAGDGKNIWHGVHIHDLSNVYLALTETAAAGGGSVTWGKTGYYLVEKSFVWGDVQQSIAQIAYERGFIEGLELDILGFKATAKEHLKGSYRWGSNSRGQAVRARLLGWKASRPRLSEILPTIFDLQAAEMNLQSK